MISNKNTQIRRLGLLVITLSAGLWHLIISFSNITDYWTNFEFVKHVLSMDTIFPNSKLNYRSISQPWVHHIFYWLIISLELIISFCFIKAFLKMLSSMKSSTDAFGEAKSSAFIGVAFGMILWFLSFTIIGAEWFGMWQSTQWNATATAKSNLLIMMGVYFLLLVVD